MGEASTQKSPTAEERRGSRCNLHQDPGPIRRTLEDGPARPAEPFRPAFWDCVPPSIHQPEVERSLEHLVVPAQLVQLVSCAPRISFLAGF